MAFGDVFGNLKQKVRSVYNNFFYEGAEAPAPQAPEANMYPPQEQPYQQPQQGYENYQQPQAPYAQEFQQPQYQQQNFRQGYQQPQYQPNYENPQQPRNRRSQQHAGQMGNNVVDFGSYQQQSQQPLYQQPQQNHFQQPAYQPQQEPAPQQPQQSAALNARIINARGMADCRSAITLLRNGDAVMIVLENVTDPAELRRLVDTLSGACYSLTATITKVSRYGVYLLAPQAVAVYADQATNQMNNPNRVQSRGYQQGYAAQNPYQAPQQPMQQQGFTQRPAQMEEPQQPFYARTAPQAAQVPSFSAQPVGYGYAPDAMEAAE